MNTPIFIEDATLQAQILHWAVAQIEQGKAPELVSAGFEPAVLDRLRLLPASRFNTLSQSALGFFLSVNSNMLTHKVRTLDESTNSLRLLENFVTLRAPVTLVTSLFRVTKNDVTELRAALAVAMTPESTGKLAAATDRAIEHLWLLRWRKILSNAQTPLVERRTAWIEFRNAVAITTPSIGLDIIYTWVMNYERFANDASRTTSMKSTGERKL